MSDASKVMQWSAEYQPWGAVQSLSGPLSLDLRFPGQWFQLEAGMHYNWHRHYDPSLGRYTQPDPLGFVDGPSVYGYAGGAPTEWVDKDGRKSSALSIVCAIALIEPTPLGEVACLCMATAATLALTPRTPLPQSKPDACGENNSCMASKGNVADTQITQDWANDGAPLDKCKWLADNKHRYRPDQVKPTEKAWGCRRSRAQK